MGKPDDALSFETRTLDVADLLRNITVRVVMNPTIEMQVELTEPARLGVAKEVVFALQANPNCTLASYDVDLYVHRATECPDGSIDLYTHIEYKTDKGKGQVLGFKPKILRESQFALDTATGALTPVHDVVDLDLC